MTHLGLTPTYSLKRRCRERLLTAVLATRSSTVRRSGSERIQLTSRPASVMFSSGGGVRARKKSFAAEINAFSSSDETRFLSRAPISLPKTWHTGTVRSVRDETGAFRNGRRPPGVNLTPKACEWPLRARLNFAVWTPATVESSGSKTAWAFGWG